MDKIVSINHTKENVLEFDVTAEGLETKNMDVRLVVKAKNMDLSFAAKKAKGDTWSVKLPKLPILEKTAYDFCVEVLAEGYHFKPFTGKLNVVGSAELYSSDPKNITIEPTGKKEKKEPKKATTKESTRPARTSPGEKSIEQIAQELMEQQKYDPEQIREKAKEAKSVSVNNHDKDQKVIDILEEIGIAPKAKKRRISFVTTRTLDS